MYVCLIHPLIIHKYQRMIIQLGFIFLLIQSNVAEDNSQKSPWKTLSGKNPVVIARGGYSGLFPDSSAMAYKFAAALSLPDVILFCDLQLSKDSKGLCQKGLKLDNSTTISHVFPDGRKTYNISGEQIQGWFALDFTADELQNVSLTQSIYSRTNAFDGPPMLPVDQVNRLSKKQLPFWLNVQYTNFYGDNKIDAVLYVQNALKSTAINFISSPEVGFLKSIHGKVNKAHTKLILKIPEGNVTEPTTKESYGSMLKDLSSIKSYASGLLVPKDYVWPVTKDNYLSQSSSSLVDDAHKEGLEVYVSGFANDNIGSFNYSSDPTAEYLQFIDNSKFSVDGFLTDFPSTASEAIACLANNKNASRLSKGKPLIITHNGASGIYASCTDLSYQQAVDDGADIIDCSVQMSKDGVPFCLDTADISGDTTAMSTFMSKSTTIPEIQNNSGIFSFDLTWNEIQKLQPQMKSPYPKESMIRNPAYKNKGKLMTLTDFLKFSVEKKVSGVLINIQNAPYLASKKGISITDAVSKALSNATLDSKQQVLIQSDDSSVLSKFSSVQNCKRVLLIEKLVGGASKQTVEEIKKYADAVNLRRRSVISTSNSFLVASTGIVEQLQKANISVYVSVFRNEFVSIAYDYFSDPMVELATYIGPMGVDGIITEFPATVTAYLRSPCSDRKADLPYTILPVKPGALLELIPNGGMPPAEAPAPPLDIKDVADPPLPSVSTGSNSGAASAPSPEQSGQTANMANVGLCVAAILVLTLLSMGYY